MQVEAAIAESVIAVCALPRIRETHHRSVGTSANVPTVAAGTPDALRLI